MEVQVRPQCSLCGKHEVSLTLDDKRVIVVAPHQFSKNRLCHGGGKPPKWTADFPVHYRIEHIEPDSSSGGFGGGFGHE